MDHLAFECGGARLARTAFRREQDLVIQSAVTRREVAWIPVDPTLLVERPAGCTWAGVSGSHLFLFTLEGVESGQ
jgi:hypothetical protein